MNRQCKEGKGKRGGKLFYYWNLRVWLKWSPQSKESERNRKKEKVRKYAPFFLSFLLHAKQWQPKPSLLPLSFFSDPHEHESLYQLYKNHQFKNRKENSLNKKLEKKTKKEKKEEL